MPAVTVDEPARLDYFDHTRDGPLVRLYGTNREPTRRFAETAAMLAASEGMHANLHDLPGILPIDSCRVELRSSSKARMGMSQIAASRHFLVSLRPDYWDTIYETLVHWVDSESWGSTHGWLVGGDARGLLGDSAIALLVVSRASGKW